MKITIEITDALNDFISMYAKELKIPKENIASMILEGHRVAIINLIFMSNEVKNA